MATPKPFPHAGFLSLLERINASAPVPAGALPPSLARVLLIEGDSGRPTPAASHLIQLLKARHAVLQASFDTDVVADELRRYQKFARPGQPSPQIVQLRQQQAAARQASSQSRQSFIRAAAAFARETGIEVPPRVALEVFITGWIEANVPEDVVATT
ncbi:hypothetical protein ACFPME_04815 [Rhodanobacter umsongensis]|uniref:Uncharacterized protein n=1 Tax=Rhodanobacter umsongensis TaxID=633153 RepID=A0ABW0JJ88_9GAMM